MRDLFGTRRIKREVRPVAVEPVEGEVVVAANGDVVIGVPTAISFGKAEEDDS